MRRMRNVETGKIINIVEHIMLRYSCWEYYLTDRKHGNDDIEALVYGYDVELATVSLLEIEAPAGFRTKNLRKLMPVPGWKWVKERRVISKKNSEQITTNKKTVDLPTISYESLSDKC